MEENKKYISYDYLEVKASEKNASWLIDGYRNFGWQLDSNFQSRSAYSKNTIQLKRARNILNKPELTRLQQHFQAVFDECEILEARKHLYATIASVSVGLMGTILVALSVFSITLWNYDFSTCLLFGIPGIALWALPLLVYPFVLKQQHKKINPLIERKKEEIDSICEKGSRLL